jgi:AraC family transcriptional regulator
VSIPARKISRAVPVPAAPHLRTLASSAHAPDVAAGGAHWIRAVRDYVDAHLGESFTLRGLAEVANVHPVHLSRAFRQHAGHTLSEYVRRRRIDRACALIRDSELTLTRVAFAVGFTEQAHFSRCFRRVVGVSPSEYRSLARGPEGAGQQTDDAGAPALAHPRAAV